jgi:hypothetical protein
MEPVRRCLEPHDQPSRLADHAPQRNRELVDERRQRMTQTPCHVSLAALSRATSSFRSLEALVVVGRLLHVREYDSPVRLVSSTVTYLERATVLQAIDIEQRRNR